MNYVLPSPTGIEKTSSARVMGVAADGSELIAIAVMGAQLAVFSVWAQLASGKSIEIDVRYGLRGAFRMTDGVEARATAPIPGNSRWSTGLFVNKRASTLMPGAHATYVFVPYDGKRALAPDEDENAIQVIGSRLHEIVNVGIMPGWYKAIIQEGMKQRGIAQIECSGLNVWGVSADGNSWSEIISKLLRNNAISFEEVNNGAA